MTGNHRELKCIPDGIPSRYKFYNWEHKTEYNEHIRYLKDSGNGTLFLPDVPSETDRYQDRGLYMCQVANGVSLEGKTTISKDYHLEPQGTNY